MSDEFTARYDSVKHSLLKSPPEGFDVLMAVVSGQYKIFKDNGEHPTDHIDYECAFASSILTQFRPTKILDIGSYRHFVFGLLAAYDVLSIDIRPIINLFGENRIVMDVRNMDNIGSFDAIISLCTLEHIGLGRYGDLIDFNGDKQAFAEIKKVLKPGDIFIFSVPITRGKPTIVFNAHRIYDYGMILNFCKGLTLVKESIFGINLNRELFFEEVTIFPGNYDIYCGCWRN